MSRLLFLQRIIITSGIMVVFGGAAMGVYKLRQIKESSRGSGICWRSQEMEDYMYCKEQNLKRSSFPALSSSTGK